VLVVVVVLGAVVGLEVDGTVGRWWSAAAVVGTAELLVDETLLVVAGVVGTAVVVEVVVDEVVVDVVFVDVVVVVMYDGSGR